MLHIPFDQYQRYKIVRDAIVSCCGGEGKGYSLLEVGGYPGVIRDFLPEVKVLLLDRVRQPLQDYIIGDGSLLPLKDRSCDFVISVDVLEHIPPEKREAFIRELVRVGRKMVCLVFPCYSKEAVRAEKELESYFRKKFGLESEFLTEHRQYGLPKFEEVNRIAKKMNLPYLAYPSSHVFRWFMMMAATYTLDYFYPDSEKLSQGLHLAYNTCFYPRDNREPSYRKLVLLFPEDPAYMKKVKGAFEKKYLPSGNTPEKPDLMKMFSPLLAYLEDRQKQEGMRKIPFGPFQVLKDTLQENREALAAAREAEADLRGEFEKVAAWAKEMESSLKNKTAEAENLAGETKTLRDDKNRLEKEAGNLRGQMEGKQKQWDKWRETRKSDLTYTRWLENIIDGKGSEEDLLALNAQNILRPEQMARLDYEYHRKGRRKTFLFWRELVSRKRGYFSKSIEGFLLRDAVVFKSNTYWQMEPALQFIQTYFPNCRITVFSHHSDLDELLKRKDLELITYTTRKDGLNKLRAIRKMRFDLAAVITGGEKIFRNLQFSAFFSRARYVLIFSRRGNVFWWNWSHRMEFYRECKLWYAEKIGLRQELNISELIISTFIWFFMTVYLSIRTIPYLFKKYLGRNMKPEGKRRERER